MFWNSSCITGLGNPKAVEHTIRSLVDSQISWRARSCATAMFSRFCNRCLSHKTTRGADERNESRTPSMTRAQQTDGEKRRESEVHSQLIAQRCLREQLARR